MNPLFDENIHPGKSSISCGSSNLGRIMSGINDKNKKDLLTPLW